MGAVVRNSGSQLVVLGGGWFKCVLLGWMSIGFKGVLSSWVGMGYKYGGFGWHWVHLVNCCVPFNIFRWISILLDVILHFWMHLVFLGTLQKIIKEFLVFDLVIECVLYVFGSAQ